MPRFKSPFFSTQEPVAVYDGLRSLPQLVKIAVYEALGSGPPESAVDRLDLSEIKRLCTVAELHLRGAHERAVAKESAHNKAMERAERRISASLAGLSADVIAEGGFDPRGFFVYCLWGSSTDRPLYVGLSTNILARLGNHLGDPTKRHQVERVTLIRCKTRGQMEKTERRLIAEYQPALNTVGVRVIADLEETP